MRLAVLAALVLAPGTVPATESLPATAAEAELVFREANDAYLAGDHDAALEGYRRLVAGGFGTADVQFNLGNAQLMRGRIGEAVVAYERALRLDPDHEDAVANLVAARRRNVDKVVGAGAGPPFLTRVARVLDPSLLTWAFLGAWLVLFGALFARRLGLGGVASAGLVVGGLVGSLVLGSALAAVVWHRERVIEAVVIKEAVPVRKGPAPRFEAAFEIHDGLKVRALDTDGPFQRIRLENGLEGWVLRDSVRVI